MLPDDALAAARERAFSDGPTIGAANRFVAEHFGGDRERAAAFFAALAEPVYTAPLLWEGDNA